MAADIESDAAVEAPLFRIQFKDAETAHTYRLKVARVLRELSGVGRVVPDRDQPPSTADLLAWSQPLPSKSPEPDCLFIEDTKPFELDRIDVPNYHKKYTTMNDKNDEVEETEYRISNAECFNCEGPHMLHECPEPKNFAKIAQKRRELKIRNLRYHADELEPNENRMIPGKISSKLRNALGLRRNQLPSHIYKMRLFGYPPGWLLHAKVSHSGLALFDSSGKETNQNGTNHSGDEYDIDKIFDFPGYNTPASSRYIDEAEKYGVPPLNENQSKMLMLEMLAPRAAQAYKRKRMKITEAEQQPGDISVEMDMDIENDEDVVANGFLENARPPLPDAPPEIPPPPPPTDTPAPKSESRSSSPSLDDLESQKRRIMAALEEKDESCDAQTPSKTNPDLESPNLDNVTPQRGRIRDSSLGTPLHNFTSFHNLPSDVNFAKDICDVINFENLPDSTGKYVQMSGLIKKIRESVTKLQQDS